MELKVNRKEYLISQPGGPEERSTDAFFLNVADNMLLEFYNNKIFQIFHPYMINNYVIYLINYYQDVIADGGVWHTFVDCCRKMYKRTLPFFETGEGYIDYELNYEDVRFLTWYFFSMNDIQLRNLSPFDPRVEKISQIAFTVLEKNYEEAPVPENYRIFHELEIHNQEDWEILSDLNTWLFLNCYLMRPGLALSMHEILNEPEVANADTEGLVNRLEKAKTECTIGPLAYFDHEWLHLIVDKRLPRISNKNNSHETSFHPYYQKVVDYTNGKTFLFFKTYEELNNFFIKVLGWDANEKHLPALETKGWFAIMVNPNKGMLVAADVARSLKAPGNEYYDATIAYNQAFELLTVRGRCPSDLLLHALNENWLPDARFPQTDDTELIRKNADFIARCYLQEYYRGD